MIFQNDYVSKFNDFGLLEMSNKRCIEIVLRRLPYFIIHAANVDFVEMDRWSYQVYLSLPFFLFVIYSENVKISGTHFQL